MKQFLFLLLFATLSFNANSQEEALKGGGNDERGSSEVIDEVTYNVVSKFPVNILHSYTLNIKSDVVRTYSDGSKYDYTRDVTYDMSYKAIKFPKEGKQYISVKIDSMLYHFKDSKKEVAYNSMDMDANPPLQYIDFENHSIPLGAEFDMVYSPYNDIVELSSDYIKKKVDYINDPDLGIKDTLKNYRWNHYLSSEHLKMHADVHRGLIPTGRVSEDTTWNDYTFFELEGIKFMDSVNVTFKDYTVRNYVLEAEAHRIIPSNQKVVLQGIDHFGEVLSADGTAKYTLKINPYGTVNEMLAVYDITAKIKVRNEEFTQDMKTTMRWSLDGMWKW